MKKYTIKDLAQGKCAVINDGTLEDLKRVLKLAFPDHNRIPTGTSTYYYKKPRKWTCRHECELPKVSVNDIVLEEPKLPEYMEQIAKLFGADNENL